MNSEAIETFAYTVRIPISDLDTLDWLYSRGYDGRFVDLADNFVDVDDTGEEVDEDPTFRVYFFSEPSAWAFREEVDEDVGAFLSSAGSETLVQALLAFYNRIV